MPHAAVFIVVFQVYVNYFILKFNYNEFDERPLFEAIRNLLNFRLRNFSYVRVPYDKKFRLQFLINWFLICGFLLYRRSILV